MFRKFLTLTLIILLINVTVATPVRAGAQVVEQTRNVEKVKENIRKVGIGDAAHLELKLWDGRKLKGYLREAGESDFTIVDAKTGATTLAYEQVRQVKGGNRPAAAKVGLSLAKGAAIVGAVALGFTLLGFVLIPRS